MAPNFYWFGRSPRWGWGCGWVKWGFGDDVGMTGMMWGQQGWHGDDRDDMGKTGMTWGRWGRRGRLHPLTHPLTHPSIQPPMNPPMARGVSANHKSLNRIELSWLSQDLFYFLWFDMGPPINPPTHQTIHPPIVGGVSTDFKASNRIKISRFVQVLLNFYWFGWPTLGGGGPRWGLNGGLGMM